MKTYDVGIGWAHQADRTFIHLLKKEFRKRKLTFREVTFLEFQETFEKVEKGELHFRVFIDRSADDFSAYHLLSKMLCARDARVVNDPMKTVYGASKAHMYTLYKKAGIALPVLEVLTPKKYSVHYLDRLIRKLGVPFVIKPSYGGGGENVLLNAFSAEDIKNFLKENGTDACLVQEYVIPKKISGRHAWFRPLYSFGKVIHHWWDPQTNFYVRFGSSKEERMVLSKLEPLVRTIHTLSGLELFSVEFAVKDDNSYVVMDYLNFPIDLNVQSEDNTSPPDATVYEVAESCARWCALEAKK